MAFFKFPWANPPQEPAKGSSRRSRAPQAESIEGLRRRARHRLIGAVILVLAGVIVFPLIFDTQPRTVPVNVAIDIPDRNAAAPLAVDGAPAKAEAGKVPAGASLVAGEEQVGENPPKAPAAPAAAPAPSPSQAQPAQAAPAAPAAAPEAKPEPKPKPEAKPAPKPEPKAEPKPKPEAAAAPARHGASAPAAPAANNDAARARALLEGHAPTPAAAGAPAASPQGERFIVQVGAYADLGKVREVRARLERAGIKTYAQDTHGKDGVRTTRVRVGPFASRAEAAKVLERIKGLGLDGAVLTL